MQRYTLYYIWKLFYKFRVVPPPIFRSAYHCIYSIWYLSHRYGYLSLAAGSSYGVTDTRCCRYNGMRSWWWVYVLPETCRTVSRFTFHYQLMHLLIKTLSQFTFKNTHVKNVCDAYLKLILKKPNMFRSVLRSSSGVNCYVSACLLRRISVCGGMLSVCVYLRCTCQCGVWMCTHPDTTLTGTSQVYTDGQHTATDWNATRQACWHVVIAQGTGMNPWWWSEDWPKHVGFF